MKTLKISATNKDKLKKLKQGNESFDKLINRLLDSVEDDLPVMNLDDRITNLGVNEDTLERLDSFALSKGESYENILLRILLLMG